MNAYVRALSVYLSQRRAKFIKTPALIARWAAPRPPKWKTTDTQLTEAWLLYSRSEAFSAELEACKAAAAADVPWMSPRDRNLPESPELRVIRDPGEHECVPKVEIQIGDPDIHYKPSYPTRFYDWDTCTEDWIYLGLRLATVGRDELASSWIRSHSADL